MQRLFFLFFISSLIILTGCQKDEISKNNIPKNTPSNSQETPIIKEEPLIIEATEAPIDLPPPPISISPIVPKNVSENERAELIAPNN